MVWHWIKNKRPSRKILKQRIEDDITVVYGKNLEICYLNKSAGIVLSMSDGKNTVSDIAQNMLKRFDVDEVSLQNDLVDIIRDLQWKNILVLED